MTWSEIIEAVAAAIDRRTGAAALTTLLERAGAGSYTVADVRAVSGDQGRSVPFIEALDRGLRTHHREWQPALLAQARALLLELPALLRRLGRIEAGRPMAPANVHSALQRIERLAARSEPPASGPRRCPRCGSSRLDTRRTTAFGTNHYEQRCGACGYIEEWDEGIALGEAMTEARRK